MQRVARGDWMWNDLGRAHGGGSAGHGEQWLAAEGIWGEELRLDGPLMFELGGV